MSLKIGDEIVVEDCDYPYAFTKTGSIGTIVRDLGNNYEINFTKLVGIATDKKILQVHKEHVRKLTKLDKAVT